MAAALGAAPPVFADQIDDAARKLTSKAYPLLKDVDWNSPDWLKIPGAQPKYMANAIAKTLEMGAAMDGSAVKEGVRVHSKAIAELGANGVTSKESFLKINSAIGHMIASAGEAKTMAAFNSWKGAVPAFVPEYLKGKVNGKDAEEAYRAFLEFKEVVKSQASTVGAAAPTLRKKADAIDTAAKTLSKAAYPFVKEVDWESSAYLKLPYTQPREVLQAVKSALDHGVAMDPKYLKEGALAHAKAISNVDAKGVLSMDDFVAVNAAIGHMLASAGGGQAMRTFYAFKGLVPEEMPSYLMSTVNPSDAAKAFAALMEFKDVVRGKDCYALMCPLFFYS